MTDAPPAFARAVRDPGSFRDPSGFVYRRDGVLYRQVNQSFADRWDDLVASGLLDRAPVARSARPARDCAASRQRPTPASPTRSSDRSRSRRSPTRTSGRSGSSRTRRSLTLDAQVAAAERGFTLRDATAYNVQFRRGRPILIDTLSFERAEPGAPWIAYRQFCEHFLAPLALMARRDVRLGLLLRDHLDGIPLDLAARLLPGRYAAGTWGSARTSTLHARAQRPLRGRRHRAAAATKKADRQRVQAAGADRQPAADDRRSSLGAGRHRVGRLRGQHLATATRAPPPRRSSSGGSSPTAGGAVVWDLGANTGRFSRIAAGLGRDVVALDIDPAAVERHYRQVRARRRRARPAARRSTSRTRARASAGRTTERRSVPERANADVVLALALVHHLAIGRNVPLDRIADVLRRPRAAARHRVRAQGRPDGPDAARDARGRLRRLHDGRLPDGLRRARGRSSTRRRSPARRGRCSGWPGGLSRRPSEEPAASRPPAR